MVLILMNKLFRLSHSFLTSDAITLTTNILLYKWIYCVVLCVEKTL